ASKFGQHPINAPAGMLVIKAPAEYAYMVDAALPFVSSVGGKPVQLVLLRRSSTIRSLYLLAWKLHNRRLQAEAALTNDPEIIQTLAKTVGAGVPGHKLKRIWDQ
uniref:Uncharacterized protein n=1 Tax=Panagrolaimus sp. PS1159 TaxID=55785 RepID=A0AC35GI16_9BILA